MFYYLFEYKLIVDEELGSYYEPNKYLYKVISNDMDNDLLNSLDSKGYANIISDESRPKRKLIYLNMYHNSTVYCSDFDILTNMIKQVERSSKIESLLNN